MFEQDWGFQKVLQRDPAHTRGGKRHVGPKRGHMGQVRAGGHVVPTLRVQAGVGCQGRCWLRSSEGQLVQTVGNVFQ